MGKLHKAADVAIKEYRWEQAKVPTRRTIGLRDLTL
jgi:hypothetical protein